MKKMLFAFACASALALFAAEEEAPFGSVATFEGYTAPFVGIGGKGDDGVSNKDVFWQFLGGTDDGSTVTAYGAENALATPEFDGGKQYLALSTEGGTLWRSVNAAAATLGAAEPIPDTGLFVDTMVQFTATEDGNPPEATADDKLAVWLADENGVKTLKVLANKFTFNEAPGAESASFSLVPADGSSLTIEANAWHRLTVKSIANVLKADAPGVIQGFQISVDGVLMMAAAGDPFAAGFGEFMDTYKTAALTDKTVFASLQEMGEPGAVSTLQAVGFKGSGAIDNLQFTDKDPNAGPEPEAEIDLTVTASNATVTGIENGSKVKAGEELSFTVAAAEGYTLTGVTINDEEVTADADGNYTYTVSADDEAVAVVVTTEAVQSIDWDHPQVAEGTAADMFGITGDLAKADGQKLATWAKDVGKVSFDKASEIKLEAFLLNCANTDDAITDAKAAFVIPAITVDAEGKVTVTPPEGEYNGVVVIKGAAEVDADYDLAVGNSTAKFFKAFLVLEAPAAK